MDTYILHLLLALLKSSNMSAPTVQGMKIMLKNVAKCSERICHGCWRRIQYSPRSKLFGGSFAVAGVVFNLISPDLKLVKVSASEIQKVTNSDQKKEEIGLVIQD